MINNMCEMYCVVPILKNDKRLKKDIVDMINKICETYCVVPILKNDKRLKKNIYKKIINKYNDLFEDYKNFTIKDCDFDNINKYRIKKNIISINIDNMIIETINYSYKDTNNLYDFYEDIFMSELLCGLDIHHDIVEYFHNIYYDKYEEEFKNIFLKNFIKYKNDILSINKTIILNNLNNNNSYKNISYLSNNILNYF